MIVESFIQVLDQEKKKTKHVLLLEVETFGFFFFFTWNAPVIFAEMEVWVIFEF